MKSTCRYLIFFFNDTATTEIYTLSLHDALPILLHCLFEDSPPLSKQGIREINHNLQKVVLEGRRPELKILEGNRQTLTEEGGRLLDEFVDLATLLDGTESTAYRDALRYQRSKLSNPENTPSARTLRMMEEHDGSSFEFAMAHSIENVQFFLRSDVRRVEK